jgi:hypothetical protein
MPTKHPPTGTGGTEDGLTQPVNKKVQRGILSTTTSIDCPKRHAAKPDKHNVAPLLAEYASAKTSKTTVSLPPISLGDNKTRRITDPSQDGVNKKTLSSLETVVEGAEVLGATPSDTIEVASTKTTVEILPPPVDTSTINNSPDDVSTANSLVEGVSQLSQPVASSTIPPDNRYESTGQISDISPEKRGN